MENYSILIKIKIQIMLITFVTPIMKNENEKDFETSFRIENCIL